MDSRTVTTILVIIICVLMFPLFIGIAGGLFGIAGSIIGGLFGLIGGLFGVIFGVIGAVFGAVFEFIGWLFGHPFNWHVPNFFDRDALTAVLLVAVIILISRSRRTRPGRTP